MENQHAVMDERGRITLGNEAGKRYGRDFYIVQAPNEIILIPRTKDPIKGLRVWGKKAKIDFPLEKIGKITEEEAYKEVDSRLKKRSAK